MGLAHFSILEKFLLPCGTIIFYVCGTFHVIDLFSRSKAFYFDFTLQMFKAAVHVLVSETIL